MIQNLEPYPAYKDSGVSWLGEVPEHWNACRIKSLFREKDERSGDGNGVLLSLTRIRGIIPQAEASNRIASAEDLSKYKVCRPGDLIMNRMQAWSGMFAVSSYDGLVSPDYSVFEAIGTLDVKYFEHFFKTPVVVNQFAKRSKGIGSGFNRLYTPDFGAVPLAIPPIYEQSAIVHYLDYIDQRIRRYIRVKKKLIKLLEEQKQAIIHQAVTRGLDPNIKLKSSGVQWLGDVPEHWGIKRLKHLTKQIVDGTHFTPAYIDEGIPFLRVTDIHSKSLELAKLRRISKEEHLLLNKRCNPVKGDILLSKNGTIGVTRVIDWDFPFSIFVSLCLLKPIRSLIDPYFLSFAFEGGILERQLNEITKTTSVTNLHLEKIRELIIPIPPLQEQLSIMEAIKKELVPINAARERAHYEISLLREYHVRLIADVVTGKLDVRSATTNLPEETDETEVFEDELSGDEETTEEELESDPEE